MKTIWVKLSSTSLALSKNPMLFLDDEGQIIEAPTLWVSEVASRRSGSKMTSKRYGNILARFLQWLDDTGYGCQSWSTIDQEILGQFIAYLQNGDAPSRKTVVDYLGRIVDFYSWARKNKFHHFLELEMREVDVFVRKNQSLLAHLAVPVKKAVPIVHVRPGHATKVASEVNKLVTQKEYVAALRLIDDPVFVFIATVIRVTAMRPKEVLQLPYKGKSENVEFFPHEVGQIPDSLLEKDLMFYCQSKGKDRYVRFPGKLWAEICRFYIPIRRKRAELYARRNGISPPNSALFLSSSGYVVNYDSLYRAFRKVAEIASEHRVLGGNVGYTKASFGARMLRHACATYFVVDALKKRNRLDRPYVYDASIDNDLRELLGHEDVETTYKYYVHLVNRLFSDDLLVELHRNRVDEGLSVMLDRLGFRSNLS